MIRVLLLSTLAATGWCGPLYAQSITVMANGQSHTVDLSVLKHVKITATNTHDNSTHEYGGILLSDLLAQSGVPTGEAFRGKQLTRSVIAGAKDNYHVLFSAAEIDLGVGGRQVLIADQQDGKPLDEKTGPVRLVVPSDKRPARWVHGLTSIEITDAKADTK